MALRSPPWMVVGLLQPLVLLVFFGPLLAGLPLGRVLRDVLLLVGRAVLLLAAAIAFGLPAIRRSPARHCADHAARHQPGSAVLRAGHGLLR
jgi:ABC-2 type transport system permease protein